MMGSCKNLIPFVPVALVLSLASGSAAAPFDFALDSLRVTQGGVLLDDHFLDGFVNPLYLPVGGTVVTESGGFLHLTSADGADMPDPNTMEDSVFLDPSVVVWRDGSGPGVLDAAFRPDAPALGTVYLVGVTDTLENGGALAFGSTADLEPGIDPPACFGPEPNLVGFEFVSASSEGFGCDRVDPAAPSTAITGALVLRLEFNDITNTITPSYSTDGGSTFIPNSLWDLPAPPLALPLSPGNPFVGVVFGASAHTHDTDQDGVSDDQDNCPFEPNNSGNDIQRDSNQDGRGDACECGNADRNEKVDIFDALHIARGTLQPPLVTMIHPRACDADGNGSCDIFDALRVAQATLVPPLAEIVQECEAATVAPQ